MPNKTLADGFELLVAASGATRLALGTSDSLAVAELAGRWQREAYGAGADAVPPVLKVIDVGRDVVTATANGWLLSPPGPGPGGWYLTEDGEELRYRIRNFNDTTSFPLSPPEGLWAVKFTAAAAGRLLVGLWRPAAGTPWSDRAHRRQELWLASIDPASQQVSTTRTLTLLTSGYRAAMVRAGVAIHPATGTIYLTDVAGGATDTSPVMVHALDPRSLETRWTATCERPRGGLAEATGDLAVDLGVPREGEQLLVLAGAGSPNGTIAERALVLDARTGAVGRTMPAKVLAPLWTVAQMVAAQGDGIALGSYLESGAGATRKLRFLGLRIVEPSNGTIHSGFDLSRDALGERYDPLHELTPTAFAWSPARGRWLVAASSFAWVRSYGITAGVPATDLPAGQDSGRERPEVKGLVTFPPTWHRSGRPRIDAWQAAQR
jgi:hypothetical protein